MVKIESETIKSAIAKMLANSFPDKTIYKNKVEQGMKRPCFFISQLNGMQEKESRNLYRRTYLMNIRYHKDNPTRTELDEIGFELLGLLNELKDEDLFVFGSDAKYEIVDDVLQFFITYKVRVVKETDSLAIMNKLNINGGVK